MEAPKLWLVNHGEGPRLGSCAWSNDAPSLAGSADESFHWAKVVLQRVADDGKTGVGARTRPGTDAVSRQADEGNAYAR